MHQFQLHTQVHTSAKIRGGKKLSASLSYRNPNLKLGKRQGREEKIQTEEGPNFHSQDWCDAGDFITASTNHHHPPPPDRNTCLVVGCNPPVREALM